MKHKEFKIQPSNLPNTNTKRDVMVYTKSYEQCNKILR